MTVDPYMRGRMNDVKSYTPPFQIGEAMQGGAVGEVVASNDPALQGRRSVQSFFGWREAFNAPAAAVQKLDTHGLPPQAFLGVAGMPGLTAYVGLLQDRRAEGRRRGVRLGRGRRGRPDRLPDRQAQGPHGDRLGRRRREGRLPEGDSASTTSSTTRPRSDLTAALMTRRARRASTSISTTSAAPTWRRR